MHHGLRIFKTWLYGGDPNAYLRYEEDLAAIKRGLDENYFEGLVQKYFLDNPHKVLMTLAPDKTFAKKRDAAQAQKLAEIKDSLTPAQIEEAYEDIQNILKGFGAFWARTRADVCTVPAAEEIYKHAVHLMAEAAQIAAMALKAMEVKMDDRKVL